MVQRIAAYPNFQLNKLVFAVTSTTVILLSVVRSSFQIDCYVCSSLAENDPLCEDPFDPIATTTGAQPQGQSSGPLVGKGPMANLNPNGSYIYLQRGCYGARKSRKTAFPATACLKLAGHFADTGEKMVVRSCALDGGSLTSDTEIVRQNHCGGFFLNERYVRGCLEACFTDGCNGADHVIPFSTSRLFSLLVASLLIFLVL